MFDRLTNLWRSSPAARFVVRTAVVAGATYTADAFRRGDPLELKSLGLAIAVSFLTALVGVLTPVEPFVGPGFAKPDVQVPMPPAVPDTSTPAPPDRPQYPPPFAGEGS